MAEITDSPAFATSPGVTTENHVLLRDNGSHWLYFRDPVEILVVHSQAAVRSTLGKIARAVESQGLYAAGYLAYEAAPAFDSALQVRSPSPLPLLWFGLYPAPETLALPGSGNPAAYELGDWLPSITLDEYRQAFASVKDYIARGETYQVNYSYRLRAGFVGSAWDYFLHLAHAQQAKYSAFLDLGDYAICSASPELFFRQMGSQLTSLPMKGTAPRGRTLSEDEDLKDWLCHSEKNRAENLMIVDMIRNDLGRIAAIGSVSVSNLFDVERYPTVLQMTSTVEAETQVSFPEIMTALFPCASITGAPKVRTMQIIAELESTPRGVYTGCIGFLAPGRQAQFNVAIRTVTIDRQHNLAEYGVGGGIVWDSECDDEFQECQLKARVLTETPPTFYLLETLLWETETGYFLLQEHLNRLTASAKYFQYTVDIDAICKELQRISTTMAGGSFKIRLLSSQDGTFRLEASCIKGIPAEPIRLALAANPVDAQSPYLFHKTTFRQIYEDARKGHPDADDVLLWNIHGQLTETTIANVVLRIAGELLTPQLSCGLLGGTFRAHLLACGVIKEAVIPVEALLQAEEIFLINAVRKWRHARLLCPVKPEL